MKEIIIDGIEYTLVPIKEEQVFSDWRLPTIQELKTLVNYDKYNPACDLEDTQPNWYWSSSSIISDARLAWVVMFNLGYDHWNTKSYFNWVRCVRDGLDGLEWSASSDIEMTWDEAIEYAKNLVAPVYYKG